MIIFRLIIRIVSVIHYTHRWQSNVSYLFHCTDWNKDIIIVEINTEICTKHDKQTLRTDDLECYVSLPIELIL